MVENSCILIVSQCWENSPLSIARFYGQVKFNGYVYLILNKDGKDIWQCTAEAKREGRDMAIMPGEPADLVRKDFWELYRKLRRDKFIEIIKKHSPQLSPQEIKLIMEAEVKQTNKQNEKRKN